MSDDLTLSKAQRLTKLTYWLYRHPRGLTAAEIARVAGVSTRTAQRDVHDLEGLGIPLWDDEGNPPRYGVISGYYLPPVHLSLDDGVALYLAARLLARYADSFDPHIAEALAKLATILPEPLARHVHATIRDLGGHAEDRVSVEILGTLSVGWATGRKVRIRHQSVASDAPSEYVLSPYFLEPAAAGNATYVIGHVDEVGELRTFKVERIRKAALLEETYELPEDFDGPALLRSAWGIMYGEVDEEVRLRFAPAVTRRLRESIWHPTQKVVERQDGGLDLTLSVAHPQEMVYWIRGWGPQVEVLGPAWLRAQLAEEARQTACLYRED
jgi:predicted DNA-binding transcriptional regulator YafY